MGEEGISDVPGRTTHSSGARRGGDKNSSTSSVLRRETGADLPHVITVVHVVRGWLVRQRHASECYAVSCSHCRADATSDDRRSVSPVRRAITRSAGSLVVL